MTDGRAHAQDPIACVDTLSDAEVRAQTRWLDARFQHGKRRIRLWWYGQMVLWGAVGIYQTVLSITADTQRARFPSVTGAVGAWLTFLQVTAIPQEAAYAPQRFRRQPDRTPEERRAKLRYGYDLLRRAAGRQALGRGFMANVTPLLWTSFWAPYMGVRFKDPARLVQLAGGGVLLSEFRIWTLPQQARWDWDVARQMACTAGMDDPHVPEAPVSGAQVDEPAEAPEPEVNVAGLGMHVRW